MYRLNPLIDVTATVTPEEILYRLENIHANLHGTKSVTGIDFNAAAMKENKTAAPKSVAQGSKKADVDIATVEMKQMSLYNDVKMLSTKLNSALKISTSSTKDESTCARHLPGTLIRPFGRSYRIADPNGDMWTRSTNPADVTVICARESCGNQLRLTITVPCMDNVCTWLPGALQMLRATMRGRMFVNVYTHSSTQEWKVDTLTLMSLSDAQTIDVASVAVRVFLADPQQCLLPTMQIDGWPIARKSAISQQFIGASMMLMFGVLIKSVSELTQQSTEHLMELYSALTHAHNIEQTQSVVDRLDSALLAATKLSQKALYLTGDTADIADLCIASSLFCTNGFDKLKLTPRVQKWLSSVISL